MDCLEFGQTLMMQRQEAPDPLRKRLTFSYLPTALLLQINPSLNPCLFPLKLLFLIFCRWHLLTFLWLLHIHQIIWHLLYQCPFPTELYCHSGQTPQLWNMIPLRIWVLSFTSSCLPQLWWLFLLSTVVPWVLDLELLHFHHCYLQYSTSFPDSNLLRFQLILCPTGSVLQS